MVFQIWTMSHRAAKGDQARDRRIIERISAAARILSIESTQQRAGSSSHLTGRVSAADAATWLAAHSAPGEATTTN